MDLEKGVLAMSGLGRVDSPGNYQGSWAVGTGNMKKGYSWLSILDH